MKLASLFGGGLHGNVIFDISHNKNRDNCFAPYCLLRKKLLQRGVSINTPDIIGSETTLFDLHMDVSTELKNPASYVLLMETPFIQPLNGNMELVNRYKKVFTWNDQLVDGKKFIKINFPNPVSIPTIDGWNSRNIYCCMIAGNKQTAVADTRELYSERVRGIRWFEKHAPKDFSLYGTGWETLSPVEGPRWRPLRKRWLSLHRKSGRSAFPSYKGTIPHKKMVLAKSRFSLCYENIRDMPGYITEKLFDSFFSGCVPVYWGANNVDDYIPANCFIDRRHFRNTAEVYRHLKSINEGQFIEYQKNIVEFLMRKEMYPFSSEFFADTIVDTIMADLNAGQ
jgi:hypothetical protein